MSQDILLIGYQLFPHKTLTLDKLQYLRGGGVSPTASLVHSTWIRELSRVIAGMYTSSNYRSCYPTICMCIPLSLTCSPKLCCCRVNRYNSGQLPIAVEVLPSTRLNTFGTGDMMLGVCNQCAEQENSVYTKSLQRWNCSMFNAAPTQVKRSLPVDFNECCTRPLSPPWYHSPPAALPMSWYRQ